MNQSYFSDPVGLYATDELVGRTDLIEKIKQAFQSEKTKVLILEADGGMGKTRLLREANKIARNLELRADPREDSVLDLYSVELHTSLGLADAIYKAIARPMEMMEYESAARALNQMRLMGEAGDPIAQKEHVLKKLIEDLAKISQSQKVVLTVDTTERAVYGLPGWVDDIPVAESIEWLLEMLLSIPNIVVLLAGRVNAKPLFERFQKKFGASVQCLDVQPFSVEENLEYFDAILAMAHKKNLEDFARILHNMPQEIKKLVHTYSGGKPILLSLLVDYLSIVGAGGLSGLLQESKTSQVTDEDRKHFEKRLIDHLIQSPFGDVLLALGRTPKGIDKDLLAKLLGIRPAEADFRLKGMTKYSFIKTHDERVFFLHDEMYFLLQKYIYSVPEDAKAAYEAFGVIKEYYVKLRDEIVERLNELYAPVELQGRDRFESRELIMEAHSRRQMILLDMLFYFLRANIGQGFRNYYRYSHEAILSRDVLFDMQLQAELSDYFSTYWREHPGLEKTGYIEGQISLDLIQSMLRFRPVCRAWAYGQYDKALLLCEEFLIELEKNNNFIALSALHSWVAYTYVWRGKAEDYLEAESHWTKSRELIPEHEIIENQTIEQILNKSSVNFSETEIWVLKAILAFGNRIIGYGQRIRGFMNVAVENYKRSALLLRELDFRIEMATTLNDMGFAQAELGQWADAKALVEQARRLRRELGPRIPIAYSLNTLAAIDVREGDYAAALNHAEVAMAIFRILEDSRGMGLTNIVYAEASRRRASETATMGSEERFNFLRRARESALSAVSIFGGGIIDEVSRHVEALIEVGCACRDIVSLNNKFSNPSINGKRLMQESEINLRSAVEIAHQESLFYREIDALVNLAWMRYYYLEEEEQVGSNHPLLIALMNVENAIPSEYLFQSDGKPGIALGDAQVGVWAQIGKWYVLHGHLDYRIFVRILKEDRKKFTNEVEKTLEDMAQNYQTGLEYSALFAEEYQGINRAKEGIYARLVNLNDRELRAVCQKIKATKPNTILQEMLSRRALWLE